MRKGDRIKQLEGQVKEAGSTIAHLDVQVCMLRLFNDTHTGEGCTKIHKCVRVCVCVCWVVSSV